MFTFKTLICDICRHKRRNIISCLLLLSVFSVIFCGYFYRNYAQEKCQTIADKYLNRCYISFRNELQFNPAMPHLSALDARVNGTSSTDGIPDIFFDAGAMAEYHHPYPASLELFETLASSEYCENYEIAYADNAYGFAESLPARIQDMLNVVYSSYDDNDVPTKILTEHIVVGGSLNAFTSIARETTSGYLYDFILQEGTDTPGPGECIITDFYAELYQKKIGDKIVLSDIYGTAVSELTVCGIYSVYVTATYEFVNPRIPKSGRKLTGADITQDFTGSPDIGTPFDRLGENIAAQAYSQEHYFGEYFRIDCAMLSLIHTDFETAYHLYGTPETDPDYSERHHFNNFFACYNLENNADITAFENEMKSVFQNNFGNEFTVYPFENSYHTFIRTPQNLQYTANDLILISIILTILICVIIAVISIRETEREMGIYLSLGFSEKYIILKTALEQTSVVFITIIPASICSRFVNTFLADGYTYLEMNGAEYMLQWEAIVAAVIICAGSFVLSAVLTSLYIRWHSPIKLIRQEF